ncbi:hypothetical protein SLNWT_4796 [Streptomyces albus]|uniref:Uncharacterized protein n=1 Tax=Streptomyces albus (strain ATCC 21838 / DSM 41398 / FERM P-419 / JCM 4703 / NBRC 107858) TaxID=1081613 RepID=A0A0B5F4D6_STRA4|nr:hypothetical protein SLNWT_4796 [Streptomyces albus]AOU79479.1 hypothetical protein SLNHY_4788 [Streptomyces albus]AYN35203.1 hypothetical protein DUI70_4705 [Streptomyces albus]
MRGGLGAESEVVGADHDALARLGLLGDAHGRGSPRAAER